MHPASQRNPVLPDEHPLTQLATVKGRDCLWEVGNNVGRPYAEKQNEIENILCPDMGTLFNFELKCMDYC